MGDKNKNSDSWKFRRNKKKKEKIEQNEADKIMGFNYAKLCCFVFFVENLHSGGYAVTFSFT